MSKQIQYRITCTSEHMIHTITSIAGEIISDVFNTVMKTKSKYSDIRIIEFEPTKSVADPDPHKYIV